jgi:hypothetical protein
MASFSAPGKPDKPSRNLVRVTKGWARTCLLRQAEEYLRVCGWKPDGNLWHHPRIEHFTSEYMKGDRLPLRVALNAQLRSEEKNDKL